MAKRSILKDSSRVSAVWSQLFGIVSNFSTINPGEAKPNYCCSFLVPLSRKVQNNNSRQALRPSKMKVKLSYISSAVRRLNIDHEVEISNTIVIEEGAVVVVKVLSELDKVNVLEDSNGINRKLVAGDIIPGVLCKRKAMKEFSGDIPKQLDVGDNLHLINDAGMFGQLTGFEPTYGIPIEVTVLGSIIRQGKQINTKDAAIDSPEELDLQAPLIAVVGTSMDIGKTTTACKIVQHFINRGLKVAYAKLTGIAYLGELKPLIDSGAKPVMDFLDGGLPSTFGRPEEVIKAAFGILTELDKTQPNLIVVEFGNSILGAANVSTLLQNATIQNHIKATIVVASNTVDAWGAKEIMNQYGVPIMAMTGPLANNSATADFIEEMLGIPTESNFGISNMPKTMKLLDTTLI